MASPGGVASAREGCTLINKYNYPETAWMLAHWPAFVLLPTIFVVLTVLALITRRWDQKDKEAQVTNYYGRARRSSSASAARSAISTCSMSSTLATPTRIALQGALDQRRDRPAETALAANAATGAGHCGLAAGLSRPESIVPAAHAARTMDRHC
jgi:hypothetical protein